MCDPTSENQAIREAWLTALALEDLTPGEYVYQSRKLCVLLTDLADKCECAKRDLLAKASEESKALLTAHTPGQIHEHAFALARILARAA
jgi:hypothetical protein